MTINSIQRQDSYIFASAVCICFSLARNNILSITRRRRMSHGGGSTTDAPQRGVAWPLCEAKRWRKQRTLWLLKETR